jgi:hypothetical protein
MFLILFEKEIPVKFGQCNSNTVMGLSRFISVFGYITEWVRGFVLSDVLRA